MRAALVERLLVRHAHSSAPEWPWFEAELTYCNARLPQALILSGAGMGRVDVLAVGVTALSWLADHQRGPDGTFAPIGSNGFHPRGGERAWFDQQPVEACAMVSASLDAQRVTGDPVWAQHAQHAFAWFLGENHLQQVVYDVASGGCRDGLHADRVNENQGAESTISFLSALRDMRAAERVDLT